MTVLTRAIRQQEIIEELTQKVNALEAANFKNEEAQKKIKIKLYYRMGSILLMTPTHLLTTQPLNTH